MNNKAVIAIGILLLVIGLIMIGVAIYRKNQNDKSAFITSLKFLYLKKCINCSYA